MYNVRFGRFAGNAIQWTDRDLLVMRMDWIDDVERFDDIDWYCLCIVLLLVRAPNLSNISVKIGPSVRFER